MLTFKKISAYKPSQAIPVYLAGEASPLPQEAAARFKALAPKPGKAEQFNTLEQGAVRKEVYAALPEPLTYDALEELCSSLVKQLKALKAKKVALLLGDSVLAALSEAFYKQLSLAANAFEQYQTSGIDPLNLKEKPEKKEAFNPAFTIYLGEGFDLAREKAKAQTAALYAMGIQTARYLVNEPANVMSPQRLAQEATLQAQRHGFEIEVYDEKAIQKMGLEAFWNVAKGSDTPPRFMVMRYMNNPKSKETLALVGKGLTYDSGGYALKPAAGMDTMFCDMGGSAAVIGAISILAAMKAKVNVVAIVAACENMLSGHAYRNGDIIGSLSGKFIEVVNTDAEGRLTLADAITYAATVIKADKIIDIATLTGAVGVALGKEITGVVADHEGIFDAIRQASEESGDKVWRMPHFEHLAQHNKSERADIKNSGGRMAGTATAALFCRAFAFGVPWGHLDIAGTAYQDKPNAKAPLGATGVGAELLARAALHLFK